MTSLRRHVSPTTGTRIIAGLGGLFLGLGAVKISGTVSAGGHVGAVATEVVLFGTPGVVLLYGAYWIPRSDIHPELYPRIAGWCLGGSLLMFGATGLLLFNTDATFVDPVRATGIDVAIGAVAGLGVGVMEARALTRAAEARTQERAHRERRDELQTLLELLPVAVFVAEADGEIVEWNEAAEEIWGGEIAESESIAEYDRYDAWWAESGEPVEPEEWPLARALRGEEITDPDEIEIRGFDGEYRTVRNRGMPIRNADGEVSRAVVTLVDITELTEYQRRLEASNERLEQFAYAASHDLQEPLRMVSSYLQLLEDRHADDLDEEAREYVDFAVDGADRMREMIDGLLAYSRVDGASGSFEPVDLEAVLADVLADLQFRIDEQDAEITSETLPTVYGDEEQLRQVLQNLLDNAIQYSGEGQPRVSVTAERDGDEWAISVRDEGRGIEVDDVDRVFDVFERLHPPDEQGGAGIGLAVCERIVERHGGSITVESEEGEGTTFTFTLPAVEQRSEPVDGSIEA